MIPNSKEKIVRKAYEKAGIYGGLHRS
jgi:hypothetical protein